MAGPLSGHAAETLGLRKLAADKGLLYGTTISARQITGDPRFVDLVLQQTGLVVAENEMKWQVMNRGERGDNDYGPADTIAAFALENHLALRGHNLLWYHRTPSWFFDLDSRQEIESAIVERRVEETAVAVGNKTVPNRFLRWRVFVGDVELGDLDRQTEPGHIG